jgi:8-oxo-dGTP diphosphatase
MAESVAGIARNGDAFFIACRKNGGDMGGKWEFPGGKVEKGESGAEALIREFREELSVDIEVGPLLGNAVFEHRGETRNLSAYAVSFRTTDFVLREHTEWRWARPEEIRELDFAGSDRGLFAALGL